MNTIESAPVRDGNPAAHPRGSSDRSGSASLLFGTAMVVIQSMILALTPATVAGQHTHPSDGTIHEHPGPETSETGNAGPTTMPLHEPGNAAFAAIQEVVEVLRARDDTDWARVDLEALRRHLVDMERFTLEAVVLEEEPIEGGLRVVVRGTSPAASASIRSALSAHASMLEAERGWSAHARPANPGEHGEGATVLEVTVGEGSMAERESDAAEIEEIRGLGYIGLMATGIHHTEHHWMIATGRRPPAP